MPNGLGLNLELNQQLDTYWHQRSANIKSARSSLQEGRLPWIALGLACLVHGAAIAALMRVQTDGPSQQPSIVLSARLITQQAPAKKEAEPSTPIDRPPPQKEVAPKPVPKKSQAVLSKSSPNIHKKTVHKPPQKRPKQVKPTQAVKHQAQQETAQPIKQTKKTTNKSLPEAPVLTEARSTKSAAEPAPITQPRFNAAYLSNPAPAYPSKSRYWDEEGKVLLKVQVSASGEAMQVLLHKSSGFKRLDQAALNAVRAWKFIPARQDRKAVAAWVVIPIEFSLRRAS
ncbi:MAG: energy transducer TonB [Candidatus Thiodiazotropha sp.]|jgi:periplasmic protein TonB